MLGELALNLKCRFKRFVFTKSHHSLHGRLAASAVAMAAAAGIVAVYIGELDDFNFYEIIYYI